MAVTSRSRGGLGDAYRDTDGDVGAGVGRGSLGGALGGIADLSGCGDGSGGNRAK